MEKFSLTKTNRVILPTFAILFLGSILPILCATVFYLGWNFPFIVCFLIVWGIEISAVTFMYAAKWAAHIIEELG